MGIFWSSRNNGAEPLLKAKVEAKVEANAEAEAKVEANVEAEAKVEVKKIISIIAIHQYRLRCFLNMLKGGNTKSFQNGAILKLIVNPGVGVTLSLVYQGDNRGAAKKEEKGLLYKGEFNQNKITQPGDNNVYIFYLVRHGQAYHNILKENIKSAKGVRKIKEHLKKLQHVAAGEETELTQQGIQQARNAGDKLLEYEDIQNAETIKYFVTDLLRTRQTMGEIMWKIDKKNESKDREESKTRVSKSDNKEMIVLPCSHEINRSKYPCDVKATGYPTNLKAAVATTKAAFQPENKSKCSPHILHLSRKGNIEDAQSIAAADAAAIGTGLNINCKEVVVDGPKYLDLGNELGVKNNTKIYTVNWDLYKDKGGRTKCGSTNFINIAIGYLNTSVDIKLGGAQTLKKRSKKVSKKRREKRSMEKRSMERSKIMKKRSKKRRTR